MATISERLAYVLTFDTSSGVKSLEKFGKSADKELGKADQKLDKLGSNMSKFGAGAVAFAGLAGAGLVKMASGAADASANMSALEQVVGDVTAQEIGKWAEGSARAVGLASKEAVAASTQFAGLGKIIGLADKPLADFARSHVELAADMAAFKNVSPQQAIEDLSSAYAGSTEVLRKYNIFLDDRTLKEAYARETGEEVSGTLTTQQKIIAVNSELYRQGADMLGQFGRESGELSGQQAILRAEMTNLSDNIGAGVLPMLVSVLGVATKVTGALSSMSPEAQATTGQIAALGVAGIGIVGTLSMIAGQVIKMRDRFTDSTGELNKFGKAAKGATIALAALAASQAAFAIINDIRDVSGKAARNVEELNIAIANAAESGSDGADVMGEFGDILEQVHKELRLSNIWTDWGKTIVVAGDSGAKSIEDIDRAFNKVLQDSGPEAARALLESWQKQTDGLDRSGQQYADNVMLIERYTSQLDTTAASEAALTEIISDNTDATEESTAANKKSYESYKTTTKAIEDHEKALAELETQVADATDVINELEKSQGAIAGDAFADVFRDQTKAFFGMRQAVEGTDQAIVGFRDSLKENEDGLEDNLDATEALREAIGVEMAQALRDSDGDYKTVTATARKYRDELVNQMTQAGLTEDQISEYLTALGLTPEQVSTQIELTRQAEAMEQLSLLQGAIDNLPESVQIDVTNRILVGDYVGARDEIQTYYNNNPLTIRANVMASAALGGIPSTYARPASGYGGIDGNPTHVRQGRTS